MEKKEKKMLETINVETRIWRELMMLKCEHKPKYKSIGDVIEALLKFKNNL